MVGENEQKYQEVVQKAIEKFWEAIEKQDFFDCTKQVGVLESLKVPDIEYFSGTAYHFCGNYNKAIEYFLQVKSESPFYIGMLKSMAIDYMYLGDYIALDNLMKNKDYECSPLDELNLRIKCLGRTDAKFISENIEGLTKIDVREVETIENSDNDATLFFEICTMFADALFAAGECINKCLEYHIKVEKPFEEFAENEDLKMYIHQYQKWCYILRYSKYIKKIKLPDGIETLATFALFNNSWEEKLRIFSKPQYRSQIIKTIYHLCRPEHHPKIEKYKAVEHLMELMMHISPENISELVNLYFDVIEKAYNDNESKAVQYLGYVYSEIVATNNDPYNLKGRIKKIVKEEEKYDFDETALDIFLTRNMSRKGHDALINAELAFNKTIGEKTGVNDYSALSLQFFRVLEIEYCEKLIVPLAKSINNSILEDMVKGNDELEKKWNKDIGYLKKINEKGQSSIELGVARTFLYHITSGNNKEDECAKYLLKNIEKFLTDEGKKALYSKQMMNIIKEASLEKYRVPGAHTGFIPYSVACEAKEYVEKNLPTIEKWFK